jgi:hypothetical protein
MMVGELDDSAKTTQGDDFARQAEGRSPGLVSDLWGFLRENKKWWLLPIILTLLLVTALVMVSGGPLAPFIYTLF